MGGGGFVGARWVWIWMWLGWAWCGVGVGVAGWQRCGGGALEDFERIKIYVS